jgi:hypothetical protein
MENAVSVVTDVTACAEVFTEPLLRNGLHNPVVPPLLGTDNIENTASSVFTELLPGNALQYDPSDSPFVSILPSHYCTAPEADVILYNNFNKILSL